MDKKFLKIPLYLNSIIMLLLAVTLCFLPFFSIISQLHQVSQAKENIPPFVFRWHKALSTDFQKWAEERTASGAAGDLSVNDISGTEWPMFSAIFYLWTTEALQVAWEADPYLSPTSPAEYAFEAIETAAALVTDPNNAHWVKVHWGADYLTRENLFYRMLLIHGMASYQKLTGEDIYKEQLLQQVETLSAEIDASQFGLLDDYPGQCYPVDVVPAIAAIQRADQVLGSDHSGFVKRAVRGFQGDFVDPLTGLPTYFADLDTGQGVGSSRGIGGAYILTWAPEIWPDVNAAWYQSYLEHFWQENWLIAGFREYPAVQEYPEWFFFDVDAGPVLAGYGTAASAFGIGAARANGDFERAYPLTAEALVASWPLFNQTRLSARLLSNLSDAPYTGEVALLFSLTRTPPAGIETEGKGQLPFIFFIGLGVYIAIGIALTICAWRRVKRWPATCQEFKPGELASQFNLWLFLLIVGAAALKFSALIGAIILGLSLAFPSPKLLHRSPEDAGS
jgi:hypothetical protein